MVVNSFWIPCLSLQDCFRLLICRVCRWFAELSPVFLDKLRNRNGRAITGCSEWLTGVGWLRSSCAVDLLPMVQLRSRGCAKNSRTFGSESFSRAAGVSSAHGLSRRPPLCVAPPWRLPTRLGQQEVRGWPLKLKCPPWCCPPSARNRGRGGESADGSSLPTRWVRCKGCRLLFLNVVPAAAGYPADGDP